MWIVSLINMEWKNKDNLKMVKSHDVPALIFPKKIRGKLLWTFWIKNVLCVTNYNWKLRE